MNVNLLTAIVCICTIYIGGIYFVSSIDSWDS